MTRNDFASLGSAAFSVVVSKRQKYRAAGAVLDALLEECECDRGCRCHLREKIEDAKLALSDAHHERLDAEQMWKEYFEIRCEDIRAGERAAGRA